MNTPQRLLLTLSILTTIFLWASAYVGIRYGLRFFSPDDVALLRYGTASVMMVIFYFLQPRRSNITPRDIPPLFLMGVLGIRLYNIALNYGEVIISAGVASFIVGLMPVFALLLAVVFLHEKVKPATWIGVGVSLFGLALIAINSYSGKQPIWGIAATFFATVSCACFTIIQKKLSARFQAIELAAFAIWFGTLIMLFDLPHLISHLQHQPLNATLNVMYLGIFPGALAYISWAYTLSKLPTTKAVTFLYIVPFITTVLSWWVLHELPSTMALSGGIIAMVGAVFVHLRRSKTITSKRVISAKVKS